MRHFTLRSAVVAGRPAYIGVGGAIDGQVNPDLEARPGEQIRITLLGDAAEAGADASPPQAQVPCGPDARRTSDVVFAAPTSPGRYFYVCSVPSQGQSGMDGTLVVQPD